MDGYNQEMSGRGAAMEAAAKLEKKESLYPRDKYPFMYLPKDVLMSTYNLEPWEELQPFDESETQPGLTPREQELSLDLAMNGHLGEETLHVIIVDTRNLEIEEAPPEQAEAA